MVSFLQQTATCIVAVSSLVEVVSVTLSQPLTHAHQNTCGYCLCLALDQTATDLYPGSTAQLGGDICGLESSLQPDVHCQAWETTILVIRIKCRMMRSCFLLSMLS